MCPGSLKGKDLADGSTFSGTGPRRAGLAAIAMAGIIDGSTLSPAQRTREREGFTLSVLCVPHR